MTKQLSKAKPIKNLIKAKLQNVVTKAVATPAMHPTKLQAIIDGMRPNLSAIHPKSKPPTMAPKKNIDWA